MKFRIIVCEIFVVLITIITGDYIVNLLESDKEPIKVIILDNRRDTIPSFINKSPKEGLKEALEYYDVKHPKTVLAQAKLETGNYKSKACNIYNNLFGLRKPDGSYYKFNSWQESVKAYKNWIQNKYTPPNDYYNFLDSMGYAEDINYTNKLRNMI